MSIDTRYWGALNDIRRLREDTYAEYLAWEDGQYGDSALRVGRVATWVGGGGLVAIVLVVAVWAPGWWPGWLAALIPGLFLVAGIRIRAKHDSRMRKVRAYGARRDEWRGLLEALAEHWNGEVDVGGIRSACRFLIEKWPDQAPQMVLAPIPGERNDRLTLIGTAHGRPVLLQVIDLLEAVGEFRPPTLAVLVACPEATAGGERVSTEQWPAELGLHVGLNRAGAYAVHGGPADALLTEDGLRQVVETLVRQCSPPPADCAVPMPAPVVRDSSAGPQEVAEHFLRALSERDALGVLTYADTLLSAGRPRELTLDEVDQAIDDLHARPAEWRKAGLSQAGDNRTYRFKAASHGELSVHMTRRQDRWLVCGYTANAERVLGIEHDFA